MGGSALYVETVVEGPRDHDEGLRTTGQMGEVMKESSNIAFTYARNFLHTVAPENRFFEQVCCPRLKYFGFVTDSDRLRKQPTILIFFCNYSTPFICTCLKALPAKMVPALAFRW